MTTASQKDEAPELAGCEGFRNDDGQRHCADVRTDVQTPRPEPARRLTPRRLRLLLALLDGPQTREEVDQCVGASNGPDEVLNVRRRFGLVIPCERQQGFDRDRHRVEFGVYRLADEDRPKARALVVAALSGEGFETTGTRPGRFGKSESPQSPHGRATA